MAQTANLALYGRINLDVEEVRGLTTDGDDGWRTRVSSNSSRFGLRGSEAIGGGNSVIFQIESSVSADAGGADRPAGRRPAARHPRPARDPALRSDGAGLEAAFDDVSGLSASCRFTDCGHGNEPGCAIRAAVAEGRLEPARLESFLKLQAELRALEIREDPLKRRDERGRWKAILK